MAAADPPEANLANLFFRNRHLLALTIAVLLVAGLSAFNNLPRIEDPRITNRNPTVLTLLPGASAARMEALVTKKLEDELKEISELKEIESSSRPGVSLITLELEDRIDSSTNEAVFSEIRDKLADAEQALPPGASKPDFDDKRGAVAYSLIVALTWDGPGDPRLGKLTRLGEELADRLRGVDGTEDVRLFGAPDEEITVTADPGELAALGLSTRDVSALIGAADSKIPAGVLRSGERDVLLEVVGELDSVRRIGAIPLVPNGSGGMVKLADIAKVERRWQDPPRDLALTDGIRAVLVAARVEPDVRVERWAESARVTVAAFSKETAQGVKVAVSFDQSRYTEARLAALGGNLFAGAAVVVLVVLLGMGWRAALVVGAALPLSAAVALFGLTFFGQQIHQMSIFGMIIAVGLLIDNAIVITDEVRKKLRDGLPRQAAVAASVRHLFSPLLASTLTTILGFMPVFLLPGNVGDFVGPIAISVVLALAGSFLVSMTVIAPLAALFAAPSDNSGGWRWWRDGIASQRLGEGYRRLLLAAVQRPLAALTMALALPVAGFIVATTLPLQFFPPADRDQFEVEVWLPNDASLSRTEHTAAAIEAAIRGHDGVERVDWLVGGSYPTVYYNLVMDKDNDPSYAHGIVRARDVATMSRLLPTLQAQLDEGFPEAQVVVSPFGQGPPYEAPVAFRIVGPHLAELKRYGDELRRIMQQDPQILHSQATVSGGEPKLWLQANEVEARLAGLSLGEVAAQFQGSLEGQTGGSVLEDLEELPVRTRYGSRERSSLERIGSLNLVSPEARAADAWVPAEALGAVSLRPELGGITRRNGERVNKVLGYVPRDALPIEVTRRILTRLDQEGFALAPGYRLEVAGDSEEQGRAIAALLTYVPVLVTLMIATVVLAFRSALLAGVIGAVATLSIGLGMLSLGLGGFPLGFNPILGTAGLIGVAINGTIVVLAAIRANPEARAGNAEAIVGETLGTTRHILSTTLTTMGGFLPLLMFTGGDFWPPLAVVIAGGVGFGVVLSLLFTPAVYGLLYGARRGSEGEAAKHAALTGAAKA